MSIVSLQQLGKYYGAQDIFAKVDAQIARGDKIGLVGPNGAGKTTLLRLILGLEEPTAGAVMRARGLRLGYLPQKPTLDSQQTLYGEMLNIFAVLREQQQQLLALAEQMAKAEEADALLEAYAIAEQRFELAGGYTYENRIQRVLSGLGFGPETYTWPITVLSGGQITRALLAKLLLEEPDLLILDEPTNHLDLDALEWLESYLQEWPHSLLVVSHDRYFLDKVVSRVWELDHGALRTYRGNYSHYATQREAQRMRQWREYREQQVLIAKTEEFIRRYKAGQRSKEAQGRETRLNRWERIERPPAERVMHLRMTTSLRSGDKVLMSDGATIGYLCKPDQGKDAYPECHCLFRTGEFLLQRGQRVALIGANGSGKTTFLRTILGQITPLSGRIRLGASVRLGYLPQTQEWLDPEKTVLNQVVDAGNLPIDQARHLLGRFLFTGDDVLKQTAALSGGELARLALAILTMRGANFLLLDEPTTHLDLESQEILQGVLAAFNGTILFVSHDRYLIDALATHVWLIEGGQMRQFEGNYTDYVQQLEAERVANSAQDRKASAIKAHEARRQQARRQEREARRRYERAQALEDEITSLEHRMTRVTDLLTLATAQQDVERVRVLSLEYQTLENDLAERLEAWEQWLTIEDEDAT